MIFLTGLREDLDEVRAGRPGMPPRVAAIILCVAAVVAVLVVVLA